MDEEKQRAEKIVDMLILRRLTSGREITFRRRTLLVDKPCEYGVTLAEAKRISDIVWVVNEKAEMVKG